MEEERKNETTPLEENDKETLVERLNNLENYLADNLLSEELKEIYANIQLNCSDFRENIFFKNIDLIEEKLGKGHPEIEMNRDLSDEEHYKRLHEIKTYDEMLKEFTDKVEKEK